MAMVMVAVVLVAVSSARRDAAGAAAEPPPGGLVPSTASFGWTQGEFSVSDDGAARYNLPLWAPRGRGKATPQLSLSYSSRAGNGPLGVGWSLGGLPSITPCPRTIAQDGQAERLLFNGTDVYCMGDNRLLPISPAQRPEREWDARSRFDFSGKIANALAPTTLNPAEYPYGTIFDYLSRGEQMPSDVLRQVEMGLYSQGRNWPTWDDYPAWLKEQLTGGETVQPWEEPDITIYCCDGDDL